MRVIFLGLIFCLVGCASGSSSSGSDDEGWRMPYLDDNSQAQPEAFSADMSVRKEMPHRKPQFAPFDFYYKHCSTNGNEAYYSKTSYDCTSPAF